MGSSVGFFPFPPVAAPSFSARGALGAGAESRKIAPFFEGGDNNQHTEKPASRTPSLLTLFLFYFIKRI